jgi:hypothetical protein
MLWRFPRSFLPDLFASKLLQCLMQCLVLLLAPELSSDRRYVWLSQSPATNSGLSLYAGWNMLDQEHMILQRKGVYNTQSENWRLLPNTLLVTRPSPSSYPRCLSLRKHNALQSLKVKCTTLKATSTSTITAAVLIIGIRTTRTRLIRQTRTTILPRQKQETVCYHCLMISCSGIHTTQLIQKTYPTTMQTVGRSVGWFLLQSMVRSTSIANKIDKWLSLP